MFVLFIYILSYCCVQTCIQKGKLQTAATYLIIIQNLETPVVGKQVSEEQAVTLSSSNLFLLLICFLILYSSWPLDCWRLHWSNPVGRLATITKPLYSGIEFCFVICSCVMISYDFSKQ